MEAIAAAAASCISNKLICNMLNEKFLNMCFINKIIHRIEDIVFMMT